MRVFAALAIALPLALATFHLELGHAGDIAFFHEWYLAFRDGPAFYRDGPGLNYPIVGVLLVCGPARAIDLVLGRALDLRELWWALKATLVVGEIALVLSAAGLARSLGWARPRALALGVYALPSTWAGGAWFGQTDVWGTVFLIATAWAAIRYRREGKTAWLVLALGSLVAALLAKQLTWFAAPALAALIALGLARHRAPGHVALALASPLALLAVDPLLVLPEGYLGHVHYVLARGAVHGGLAVASGASVWALVAPGGTAASAIRFLGIDSFAWGWIGFGASQVAMAIAAVRRGGDDRSLVITAGASELAMAVLLTGVHERYLAHAIPLLVIGAGPGVLAIAVGSLGGMFVLASLHPAAFGAMPLALASRPLPLAITSLAWLGAILVAALRREPRPTAPERPGEGPR